MMARPQHEESRASDRTTKVGSKNESKGDWGVRSTTRQLVLQWMKSCGLRVDQVVEVVPKRARPFSRLSKIARTYLSSEFLVLGHKASARQAATDSQSSEKRIASETASIASA
jgi:hypothetical protein